MSFYIFVANNRGYFRAQAHMLLPSIVVSSRVNICTHRQRLDPSSSLYGLVGYDVGLIPFSI